MVKKTYIKPSANAYCIQPANIMAGSGTYNDVQCGGPTSSFSAKGSSWSDDEE